MDGTDRRRTAFSIYIGVVQSRIQYVIKYTIDTNRTELQELAHHLEDHKNTEKSHTIILNSLSQRVTALENDIANSIYPTRPVRYKYNDI